MHEWIHTQSDYMVSVDPATVCEQYVSAIACQPGGTNLEQTDKILAHIVDLQLTTRTI